MRNKATWLFLLSIIFGIALIYYCTFVLTEREKVSHDDSTGHVDKLTDDEYALIGEAIASDGVVGNNLDSKRIALTLLSRIPSGSGISGGMSHPKRDLEDWIRLGLPKAEFDKFVFVNSRPFCIEPQRLHTVNALVGTEKLLSDMALEHAYLGDNESHSYSISSFIAISRPLIVNSIKSWGAIQCIVANPNGAYVSIVVLDRSNGRWILRKRHILSIE